MWKKKILTFVLLITFTTLSCNSQTVTALDKYINMIENYNEKQTFKEDYYSEDEYRFFKKYYTKVIDSLKLKDYERAQNVIKQYLRDKKPLINITDNDYKSLSRNFEVYRFMSFFILCQGLMSIDSGEKEIGNELLYLSFYILKKYNKLETKEITGAYHIILYDLLRANDISFFLKDIKDEKYMKEKLFFGLDHIKTRTLVSIPMSYKNDKEYQLKQNRLTRLSPAGYKNNRVSQRYKVEYFSSLKPIEASLLFINNAVDNYSRDFFTRVRNETGLNISEEAGTENKESYINIMVNDDLGLRLLKKHILDL